MEDHIALLTEIRDLLREQEYVNRPAYLAVKKINEVIEPKEWTVEKILNPHVHRWSDNSMADTIGWMTREEALNELRNLRKNWDYAEGEEPFFYTLRKKD